MIEKEKFKIAGLGEVLWDIFPDAKKLGGAPANFSAHAQQLGAKSYMLSAVGNDDLGKNAIDLMGESQLDISGLQINEEFSTGSVRVSLDDTGNPTYTIEENVAWDHIQFDATQKKIAQCLDAICFGTLAQRNVISQNTIFKILKATPENCLRVFDVNFRKDYYNQEILFQSLELANVVKMNEEEFLEIISIFSLPSNQLKGLEALMNQFDLKFCILTLGKKGSIMISKDQYSNYEPSPIIVKSTVGAGDAFTAAAVMGRLNQKPLDQINKEASRLAAYVCSELEAVPIIKHV
jgi:fructokinase